MATNLALDDALIEEARRIGRHKTKKEAVTSALQEYVRRSRVESAPRKRGAGTQRIKRMDARFRGNDE